MPKTQMPPLTPESVTVSRAFISDCLLPSPYSAGMVLENLVFMVNTVLMYHRAKFGSYSEQRRS